MVVQFILCVQLQSISPFSYGKLNRAFYISSFKMAIDLFSWCTDPVTVMSACFLLYLLYHLI